MDMQAINHYLTQYGAIAIFVMVFLEYLNLPGFPAGLIMPLAGIFASQGKIGFLPTILLTVAAGLAGSWVLYWLGRTGGALLLERYLRRFPKQRLLVERNMELLRQKGFWGVFVGKLIPMVRTLISIPAGVLRMDFLLYTLSSALGILLWNLALVGGGYCLGDTVFRLLS